jgi:rare lipoprotein A
MVMRRKFSNLNAKIPLKLWLAVGASSVALAAGVITLATRTVHAYAPLPLPAAPALHAAPATSATPIQPAPQETVGKRHHHKLRGIASWYGAIFHGRQTASGEIYNMYAMTACHSTLPFGSLVRVINTDNKKSVVVRITDRGDLIDEGRIIDLSFAAAQKLAMLQDGLAPVKLEVLSLGRSQQNK